MARNEVCFEGIGTRQVTYVAGTALASAALTGGRDSVANLAVAVSGNKTVDFGANNSFIHGIVDVYENDGHAGIIVEGYAVNVPLASGATATAGQMAVNAGNGEIKGADNTNGLHAPVVVDVDTNERVATIFLG